MAITSVDSYLLKEIEQRLHTVLSNCYIINEVLKDYNESTRENFIEAFCGKNAQYEITVGFKTPTFKNNTTGHYLIQLGNGVETNNSLGNIQGDYDFANGNTLQEYSVVYKDNDRLKIEVSQPIDKILAIEDIEFASSDNVEVEDNVISFDYETNEDLENYEVFVTYVERTGDSKGLVKGFTVEEQATIVGLSNNLDTARCMDGILKMILISMRDNVFEQQSLQLQSLSFGDLAPMITETDFYIWGRPTIITYTTSMDMDYTITQEINKITMRERTKYGKKTTR